MRALHAFTLGLMATAAPLFFTGCRGADPETSRDTISREAFIQAYYQLRREGLRSMDMEISLQARDSILRELGVNEEDLLTFVDVWGTDPELMLGIWEEVDSLQREERRRGEEEVPYEEAPPVEPTDENRRGGGS